MTLQIAANSIEGLRRSSGSSALPTLQVQQLATCSANKQGSSEGQFHVQQKHSAILQHKDDVRPGPISAFARKAAVFEQACVVIRYSVCRIARIRV